MSEQLIRWQQGEALIDVFRLGKMVVPIENHGARATCKGTFVV